MKRYFRHGLFERFLVNLMVLLSIGCADPSKQTRETTSSIRVKTPSPGASIRSPLTVRGEARGPWFFEGDFPILLMDCDNQLIARGYVSAQDKWMTEEFVPFEGTLKFDGPTSCSEGRLILESANPSGRAELRRRHQIQVTLEGSGSE